MPFISENQSPPSKKFSIFSRVLYLVLLSMAVTSLMVLDIDQLPSTVREGTKALQDIKAEKNYEFIDEKTTQNRRTEVTQAVLPVYDFETILAARYEQNMINAFDESRKSLIEKNLIDQKINLNSDIEKSIRQNFQTELSLKLDDSDYKTIREDLFSEDLENALLALLLPVQKKPILHDKDEFNIQEKKGIRLRKKVAETGDDKSQFQDEIIKDPFLLLSREEAQENYGKENVTELKKKFHLDFTDQEKIKVALKLLPKFIKVNVTYNKEETEKLRKDAGDKVQNIVLRIEKGQMIIKRGETYASWHLTVIENMRNAKLQTNDILEFIGVCLLSILFLFSLYFFATRHIKKFTHNRKDLYFVGLMLIGFIAFLRLSTFMAGLLQDSIQFIHIENITTFYYMIPMATGAMMVRYILNSEIALVYAIILGFFSGLFLESNFELTLFYLTSSVAAAHMIGHVEKRSSIFRCGLYIGVINLGIVLSFNLIHSATSAGSVSYNLLLINSLFAFTGGVLSAFLMLSISPVFETLFNYTTNIHLLELANMNHPLLREMIVRAPGTYHHSQLVGILAEAGSRAIGSNPLLARVGSYYHDIGKMKKPQYFIENQKGVNPHDHLAPSMSALIIEAHVKDGIEMAKEYKLPKVIVDFIPEHQGTKLIGFFYNKAKKLSGPNDPKINERDFRYLGPRPQTRESGIVMLADTVEAAVRSMPEKSPQKIQTSVEKLVNIHFVDGQLDECDLTLKDLHLISDAFVKILVGMYHQRVEYPSEKIETSIQIVKKDEEHNENSDHQQPPRIGNISPLFKK